jgi:hypothetical protein
VVSAGFWLVFLGVWLLFVYLGWFFGGVDGFLVSLMLA